VINLLTVLSCLCFMLSLEQICVAMLIYHGLSPIPFFSVPLSLPPSFSQSLCVSVFLCICLCLWLCLCISVCLVVCLSLCLSLSVTQRTNLLADDMITARLLCASVELCTLYTTTHALHKLQVNDKLIMPLDL